MKALRALWFGLMVALAPMAAALAQSAAMPVVAGALGPAGAVPNCAVAPCFMPGGETGPASAQVAVANTTHNAGSSIGGLITISLNSTSAIFTGLGYKSENASVAAIMIRAWSKNPVNTTCSDGVAFVSSNADDLFRIVGFPTASITPVAPAQTTGDSATYGDQTIQTWSFSNKDVPLTTKIYLCDIAAANDTLDPGHNVDIILAGPQP